MSFEKATPAWTIPWDDGAVTTVTFLGSSRKLAAGNDRGEIYVFDLAEKAEGPPPVPGRRLDGHTNTVTALGLIPPRPGSGQAGSGTLVSASYDHTIRWWDLAAPGEGSANVVLDRKAREAAAKKSGKPVDTAGVSVELQKTARTAEAHQEWIRSISIGAEGKQLLSGDDKGVAILWNASDGTEVRRFQSPGFLRAVALSADGRLAATCEYHPPYGRTWPDANKIWDAATGTLKMDLGKELKKGEQVLGMGAAAFSPDGKILAFGQGGEIENTKGKIILVDPDTGKKLQELVGNLGGITNLAFSPDGKLLASSGRDTLVKLWSMPDGKLLQDLGKSRGGQSKDWIHAAAFSPDGSRLVAGDMAGLIHLWDLA